MPEHTSFLSYFIHMLPPAAEENMRKMYPFLKEYAKCSTDLGCPVNRPGACDLALGVCKDPTPLNRYALEPLFSSLTVILLVLLMAVITRNKVQNLDEAVVPENKLSIRTLIEFLVETFYKMLKEMMGAKRAKRYLPLIGTCACFIFFSNILSLIPGFTPPTSNLNITIGCAVFVFVAYNYYGFQENGVAYLKHFTGPVWWLAWLIGPIEIISNVIRPVTLSIRLMLNMSVDHLVLGIIVGLLPLFVPLPLMVLGTLVAVVQTFVFCLLSSIYVSMATEHDH